MSRTLTVKIPRAICINYFFIVKECRKHIKGKRLQNKKRNREPLHSK